MCCHSTFFCAVMVLLVCVRTTHVGSAIVALLCTACNFVLKLLYIFSKKIFTKCIKYRYKSTISSHSICFSVSSPCVFKLAP